MVAGCGGVGVAAPDGNGLPCRGLADTNEANGSAGGGVAVANGAFGARDVPGTGDGDWEAGRDEFREDRIS